MEDTILLVAAVILFGLGCGLTADVFNLPTVQAAFAGSSLGASFILFWLGMWS